MTPTIPNKYDILAPDGVMKLHSGILNASCVRKFSLMNEDSVTLNFSLRNAAAFPVGSSVGDFFITKEQLGIWNANTGLWDYSLKFDAYYWLWANKILRYVIPGVDTARETSFTLTATINVHANVILNCLNFLGLKYGDTPFRVDAPSGPSAEPRLVRYENLSILGGIQAIAEAFSCEWWVDGNAICFGRCIGDGNFTFRAGVNVSSIQFSQGREQAPNRLYVFGSDRNLPANYRQTDGNDTVGGVVNKRLMLPAGTPYLQTDPNLPESQIVEAVAVIDSVYPKTSLTVSDVETYSPDTLKESESGSGSGSDNTGTDTETGSQQVFYRLKYGDGFPFLSEYILPNEELHIVFESGLLNGMDFGVRFNPRGVAEKRDDGSINPDAQMLEVIANSDYGRTLPDEILKPQEGDKFSLYGWDSTKMADLGLIAEAEAELLAEGYKALAEYSKDTSTCTCPMAWDYMKPLFAANTHPKPGDTVTVMDSAHFGNGGRTSRIIGYEYKLDKPYAECTYTCGESVTLSRLKSIEQKIEGLAKSGTKVQMQNSLDFLSKRYADRTPYLLASDTGFEVGDFLAGVSGGRFAIDKETGHSYAELDRLYVRVRAYFESLTVIEREALAGEQQVTPGGGVVCTSVVAVDAQGNALESVDSAAAVAYRCHFLSEQDGEKRETKIIAGDQAIAQTWNAGTGTSNKVSNKRWWRLVTAVSNDAYTDDSGNHYGYIEVSRTDCEVNSDLPEAGDEIVQFGNRTDATRQTAIVISTVSSDAPSMKLFTGIGSGTTNAEHYSLAGRDIISYGYDHAKGRAYMRCYGDLWLGDKGGTSYVKYDAGEKKWLFHNVSLSVTSTIGDKTIEQYIKDVVPPVTKEDIEGYVNAIVDPKIDGIQNQIDGVIETWFADGVPLPSSDNPTLSNYPANGWATEALRIRHLGDLYYDNETGTAYRYSKDDAGAYYWNVITDSAITEALAAAKKAQDTADGKRRTFMTQPTPPYDPGDIWVNATYGTQYSNDILRCVTAKASGEAFAISDWTLASSYTDDTLAQAAKDAADAAKTAADNAKAEADAAKDRLDAWAADGVISPTEKQGIKDETARIDGDKSHINAEYAKYDLGTPTAYNDAHAAYRAVLVTLSAATPENIPIPSDFATKQEAYYTARTDALKAISNAADAYAKSLVDALDNRLSGELDTYKYIKDAINKGATTINGGLFLSSHIKLGEWTENADGTKSMSKVWAGLNGLWYGEKTPFLWGGDDIIDRFYDGDGALRGTPLASGYAKALIRMDGSAYFSGGNVGFEANGSGWFGDKSTGNVITFANGAMTFGNGIKIDLGGGGSTTLGGISETLGTVLTLMNAFSNGLNKVFTIEGTDGQDHSFSDAQTMTAEQIKALRINVGAYSVSFVSAKGKNANASGGGGGATQLRMLEDVLLPTNVAGGSALVYDAASGKWVSGVIGGGLDEDALAAYLTGNGYAKLTDIPSLSGYATQQWVTDKGYATESWVEGKGYLTGVSWEDLADTPTTLAGYGITNAYTKAEINSKVAALGGSIDGKVSKAGDIMTGTLQVKGEGKKLVVSPYNNYDSSTAEDGAYAGISAWVQDASTFVSLASLSTPVFMMLRSAESSTIMSYKGNGELNLGNLAKLTGTSVEISGKKLTAAESVKIGGGTIEWDGDCFKFSHGLYTESFVSAKGKNANASGGGGGGKSYLSDLLDVDLGTPANGEVLVYSGEKWVNQGGYATQDWVEGKGYLTGVSWGDVSGKPTWIGSSKPTYDYSELTGKPTIPTVPTSLKNPYALTFGSKTYDGSAAKTITAADLGALTSITKAQVEAVLTGNITSHTHSQYLTSHQSLANYVTLNTAQTISGAKTFTGDVNMSGTGEVGNVLRWSRNTDWAQIWFKNTADGDTDSYLGFQTGDNGNEYFRFSHRPTGATSDVVWATIKSAGITATSFIKSGGTSSQFLKADGSVDSNAYLTTSAAAATYQPKGNYLTALDHINSIDSRSTATLPNSWSASFRVAFKANSTNRLNDGGNYNGELFFRPYGSATDNSGGFPHQLGFTANGNIWHRIGDGATTWGAWKRLAFTSDLDAKNFIKDVANATNTTFAYSKTGLTSASWLAAWNGYELRAISPSVVGSLIGIGNYLPLSGGTLTGVLTAKTEGTHTGIKLGKTYLSSLSDQVLLQNCDAIRFGGDSWDWNVWAGLKYVHADKTIYLGLADNTIFNANAAQSGGSLKTPGISNIYIGTSTLVASQTWVSGNYLLASSYTAADVLAKIKTVDGSGSGLDADLLDGVHNGALTANRLNFFNRYSSSTSDTSNLAIIKQHYTELPVETPTAIGLSHGSLSMAFGWRLGNSYNSIDKAYCGWFISDYGTPRWIGADNGAWKSETFAFTSSNVASATKLATTRYLWNRPFDGTGDVSGDMTKVGTIYCQGTNGLYREGLRIKPHGTWATILLGGSDLTADSGTSAKSWSIHNNDGTFYINKNNSSTANNARAMGTSTGWTFGNTTTNSYALNAASFICDSWVRTKGATGWYNETHGGGWYMEDATWVRTYSGKSIYAGSGIIRTDGSFHVGNGGSKFEVNSNGSVFTAGSIYSGENKKNSQSDGKTGVVISSGGCIAISRDTPYINFHFGNATGYTSRIIEEARGKLKFECTIHNTTGIYSDGNVSAKGQNTSDARLKTDIADFNAADIIMRLHPRKFRWNALAKSRYEVFRTDETQYGLIAQEVRDAAPFLVEEHMFGDEFMSVWYHKLIPILLQGEIELVRKTDSHERRIERLERENMRLKKEIETLKRKGQGLGLWQ